MRLYSTRNDNNIPQFKVKHNFFQNICNSENLNIFKKKLLKFIRPSGNSVFRCHNPKGIKLLTRLRLGLSHLREHKFKHGFLDSLNPICSCGQNIETSTHFLLHYSNYSNERLTFLNIVRIIGRNTLDKTDLIENNGNTSLWHSHKKQEDFRPSVSYNHVYGDSSVCNTNNTLTINATMQFPIVSKRFDVPFV